MMRTHLAGLLAVGVAVALVPAVPAAAIGPKWTNMPPVPLPQTRTGAELRDVTAISSSDAWAVGGWSDTTGLHTLAAHWNGTGWTVAPIPDGAGTQSQYTLTAVASTAAHDVWAAGNVRTTVDSSVITRTLVLHYDGAKWTEVPTASAQLDTAGALSDIDMLSGSDGWAVGHTASVSEPQQALIMRSQSGQWAETTPVPIAAGSSELSSVFARSADDAWAVGSQSRADGTQASLVLHWDGASWREVAVPGAAGDADEFLTSVAALTPTDVWAVGRACAPGLGLTVCRPLVLRLTGGAWQIVATAGGGTELTEVVPLSATDVWAIGYSSLAPQVDTDYAEHWDGQRFTADAGVVVPPASANGEPASALLAGTIIRDTRELCAVGWLSDPKRGMTHAIRRG